LGRNYTRRFIHPATLVTAVVFLLSQSAMVGAQQEGQPNSSGQPGVERDLLYVAVPGRSNDIQNGGIGVLVFDAKKNYRFVKRIATWDYAASQEPEDVKGIAASPTSGLLYISTIKRLGAIDLKTDKMVWEQTYDGNCCDRMAVAPDGKTLYVPALEGQYWYVVDALTGKMIQKLDTPKIVGSHNTIVSLDGSRVFLAGWHSNVMAIADTKTNTIVETIKFGNIVRPFTISRNDAIFANVDDLLGFEVADSRTGEVVRRVEVAGFGWSKDRVTAHRTPSHGIALSPDEKELWLADGVNGYLHIFDATVMPPRQVKSIPTRAHPYWITFGIDGKFVYPSSGDVIDAATKQVVGGLKDEIGRQVESEKLLEVLFLNGKPVRAVDQFGVG
jgi:DNA-binding beta-propeller fold protein YncE